MKTRKQIQLTAVAMVLYAWGATALAADYYVAPNGSDGNSGTLSKPWQTIGKANASVGPGDTVYIRGGVYDDVIEPYTSGTASARIVYRNYASEQVTVRGQSGSNNVVALGPKVNGPGGSKSYITVSGLNIKHKNPTNSTVDIEISGSGSRNNEILNCKIVALDVFADKATGADEIGIRIYGARNNLIEGNLIEGLTKQGLKLINGAQYNIVRNNIIRNNWGDAIRVDTGFGVIQGNLIEGNILSGSLASDGVQLDPDYGATNIETDISNRGVIIRKNVIFGNAENGVDLKGTSNIVVEGNIIYGNRVDNDGFVGDGKNDRIGGAGGVTLGARRSSRDVIVRNNVIFDNYTGVSFEEGWKYYNNTMVGNNRDYTGPNSSYDPNATPSFVGAKGGANRVGFKNNIVGDHNIAEMSMDMGSTVDIDYNIYFNTKNAVTMIDYDGKSAWERISYADWKSRLAAKSSIRGNDKNSKVINPQFVNVPNFVFVSQILTPGHDIFDFNLKAGSPAIDAGGALTTTTGSGSGTKVAVQDAGYFYDGFGIVEGDMVKVGSNAPARIVAVDYGANTLTLDRSVNWSAGDAVNLPYTGSAPDIGALENGLADAQPPANPPAPLIQKLP